MADEPKDMEFSDIRAALGQTSASSEKAPEATPSAEPVVETPPAAEEPVTETETTTPPPTETEQQSRKEKRFSKITKERDEASARASALEARLAALEASRSSSTQTAPTQVVDANGKPEKPNIDKFNGENAWAEYSKALEQYDEKITDWKVNQALAKKEHESALARAKAEYEKVHNSWTKQVADATEDNDDIEDAIKTVGTSVAKKGIIDVIKESDSGVKMVLYLHRNPDELAKVEGMSMASAARYLGKIEARIEGETAAAIMTKPPKTLPKPPAQLGGAPSSTAKPFDYQKASDLDFKAQLKREGILR